MASDSEQVKGLSQLQGKEEKILPIALQRKDWGTIIEVLGKRPELVNFIPGNASSGLLDFAIKNGDEEVIRKMLAIPGCDRYQENKDGESPIGLVEDPKLHRIMEEQKVFNPRTKVSLMGQIEEMERELTKESYANADTNSGDEQIASKETELPSKDTSCPMKPEEGMPVKTSSPDDKNNGTNDDTVSSDIELNVLVELNEKTYEELRKADALRIEQLSDALENGGMDNVVCIIDTNQHLVNVVPPELGLSPLHQAAIMCDANIHTPDEHELPSNDTPSPMKPETEINLEQSEVTNESLANADTSIEHDQSESKGTELPSKDTPSPMKPETEINLEQSEVTNDSLANADTSIEHDQSESKGTELPSKDTSSPMKPEMKINLEQSEVTNDSLANADTSIGHDQSESKGTELPSKDTSSPMKPEEGTPAKDSLPDDKGNETNDDTISKEIDYNVLVKTYEELRKADALRIEQISDALENGDMDKVVSIIDTNQHLVNVVPPKIGFGPLHQAAIMGDVDIVNILLYYPASNPDIQTTASEKNIHGPGKTAEQLTSNERVKESITQKKRELSQVYFDCPTFVQMNDSNKILMNYTAFPLDVYKGLISSEMFASSKFEVFTKMVEDIFLYTHLTIKWENAKEITCRELNRFDHPLAETVKKFDTKETFYKGIIQIYTSGNKALFGELNTEMRKQAEKNSLIHARFSKFRSYAAIVNAILFAWEEFQTYTGDTYRGMNIPEKILEKYTVGTEFAWLAFVSSSSDKKVAKRFGKKKGEQESKKKSENKEKAENGNKEESEKTSKCLFIFNNKTECKWSPKSIESISKIQEEKEYLYPSGAQFRVTKVDEADGLKQIHLMLISPIDTSAPRNLFEETQMRSEQSIKNINKELSQFKKDLSELRDFKENINGENNNKCAPDVEEEIKAMEEKLKVTIGDGSNMNNLLMEITENIDIMEYGLTDVKYTLGKRMKQLIFQDTMKQKQQTTKRLRGELMEVTESLNTVKSSFQETIALLKAKH